MSKSKKKTCSGCRLSLPTSAYGKSAGRGDGLQAYCKQCQAANDKRHYMKHRAKILARKQELKVAKSANAKALVLSRMQGGCSICGETDVLVLEFHHKNPDSKRYTISALMNGGHSLATLKAELDKCSVVCANCHRRTTNTEIGSWRASASSALPN